MRLAKKSSPSNMRSAKLSQPSGAKSLKKLKPFNKPNLKIRIISETSPKPSAPLTLKQSSSSTDLEVLKTQRRKLSSLKSPKVPSSPCAITSPRSPRPLPVSILKNLNEFEKEEILNYESIFYAGNIKHKVSPNSDLSNLGFDFENGNYKLIQGDHLAYRYEIKKFIGKGSYGVVCECFDHKKKENVAIKILKNKKHFHRQGGVEISILKTITDRDPEDLNNLVKIKFYFIFRNHICIVFPLLSISVLDSLVSSKFEGFSMKQVREYSQQIAKSLAVLEELRIIHCDLKPENLLFTNNGLSQLKLIDFGSSCFEHEKVHTYIQSRFYRAPEIVLGINYTTAIDMWSLGCLVIELYSGKPLFPCENEPDLFLSMIELLGVPPVHIIDKSNKKNLYFDENRELKNRKLLNGKQILPNSREIPEKEPVMLNFVMKCLEWDPDKRMKPKEALNHPWLSLRKKGKSLTQIRCSSKKS